MDFRSPITDDDIECEPSGRPKKILVYRFNGGSYFVGADPVWRRPIKFKRQWLIHDHGRVPLRGVNANGTFTT